MEDPKSKRQWKAKKRAVERQWNRQWKRPQKGSGRPRKGHQWKRRLKERPHPKVTSRQLFQFHVVPLMPSARLSFC